MAGDDYYQQYLYYFKQYVTNAKINGCHKNARFSLT
jgi:hypothetical protein